MCTQGPHVHQPWACNVAIMCGGVPVRPGDAIIGDQDGVVVIPSAVAEEVYEIAHSREVIEDIVKEELVKNPGPPGRYYPFITGKIKKESPLGQLLDSKGIKYYSTSTAAAAPRSAAPAAFGGPARTQGRSFSSRATFGARSYSTAPRSTEDMEKTIQWFGQHKATAVLRTNTAEAAPKAMGAAIDAGFKIAEFTLTTPGCLDCVSNFRESHPDVLIGCGTVMDTKMAADALDAGAQFLVSPCLIPEVVTYAAERNVVIVPGCNTPTELYNAYLLGAQIQKVFPGTLCRQEDPETLWSFARLLKIDSSNSLDGNDSAMIGMLLLLVMMMIW